MKSVITIALTCDRDEDPLEERERGGIEAGERRREQPVDQGTVDDDVDLVEAVAKDRDADGDR
jgi:hypothetical protein